MSRSLSGGTELNCAEVEKRALIERYVTGQMPESEQDRLEEHLLRCDSCREQLEDLALFRERLKGERWAVGEERVRSRSPWQWALAAAAVVLVLTLAFWPRLASPPAETAVELDRLVQVEAPPYEPRRLRAVSGEAEQKFEEAMLSYREAAYADAIPGLEAAAASDPTLVQAHFYLGASYLLTDRPQDAIGSFRRIIELGGGEYLEWAYLYRAKAYLRLGEAVAARADLDEVVRLGGELRPRAEVVLGLLGNRGD